MAMNSSLSAYDDCSDLYARALADERGIRITCDSTPSARKLISRLHYCRRLLREANAETYPSDHPMHGKSEYDAIIVRLREIEDKTFLYLERITAPEVVESLSELD